MEFNMKFNMEFNKIILVDPIKPTLVHKKWDLKGPPANPKVVVNPFINLSNSNNENKE